jgi:hypothetical protein
MNIFEDEENPDLQPKASNTPDPLDQTTDLQKDKIFNNNYESTDIDTTPIKFKVADNYRGGESNLTFEERLELDMAFELISEILDKSKFTAYNKPDKDGNFKKLNKLQINEVYSFTAMQLPNFSRIKMFSILQEYFDVNSNKFYDSLSNTFKKELVEELRSVGFLHDKLGGPLF